MIFSILNFFRGYLIIEINGPFTERFINLAIRSNIFLWGIEKQNKNHAKMKISVRGFFHLRRAARKTKTKVKIVKRCGLPLFMHKHRKRKAFYAGFLIFALMLIFLSSFIWSVEIVGIEKTDEEALKAELKACGIDAGVLKYGHSLHEIQERLMLKVPTLSWIWVEIRGTRAIVSVKERIQKPEIFDKNTPCNLIAETDGVIENITVIYGNQVIKEGDIVKKGDLLVSGVYDTKYDGIRLLNAEGSIIATTWYEKKETFPLSRTVTEKTGNKDSRTFLKIFGKEIGLFFKKVKYNSFEEKNIYEKQIKLWGDLYLPITFKKIEFAELFKRNIDLSEEEAFVFYRDLLSEEIESGLSRDTQVLEKNAEYKVENGMITVSVTLRCREDIAEKRAIQTGG